MPVTVKFDVSEAVNGIRDIAKRQIPFVMAKTLTQTATVAREATRNSLETESHFTIRNAWTKRGIKAKPASMTGTNGRIEADVHTDLSQMRPGGIDYLALQDSDYVRNPTDGHTYLCIPTNALRYFAGGSRAIIPDALKPTNLLNYAKAGFKYTVSKGKLKGATRGVSRVSPVRGMVFFTDTHIGNHGLRKNLIMASGARGIWARKVDEPKIPILLWIMVRQTKSTKKRFFIEQAVQKTVDGQFAEIWDKNWRELFAKGFRL